MKKSCTVIIQDLRSEVDYFLPGTTVPSSFLCCLTCLQFCLVLPVLGSVTALPALSFTSTQTFRVSVSVAEAVSANNAVAKTIAYFIYYLSGKGGITGAALPPNPEITCDGSAATGAEFQLGAGVYGADGVLPNIPLPKLGVACGAADPPVVEKLLPGVCSPPLLAPPSFSCVRPNAAIPNTAPMAIWNRPAPCSVSGFHCVIGLCVNVCSRLHKIGNTTMSMVHTVMYIQPIMGRHFEFIQSSFFFSDSLIGCCFSAIPAPFEYLCWLSCDYGPDYC